MALPRQRVTLADVAARAGVSASTASLAFSGAGPVAEATRARVLAAAAELGYAGPDPVARSLRQRRSGVVGVVLGGRLWNAFRDPVAVALLDGVSEELTPLGSGLLLLPSTRRADTAAARLSQAPVDVLVFATCGADDDPLIGQAQSRGIPMLGIEGPHLPGVPLVDLDQQAGSREATEHLLALGHRDIAVITLPLRSDTHRGPVDERRQARATLAVARSRLAGVGQVLKLPPGRVVETAANAVEEGERAAAGLLAADPRPTAILAQSDLLAVGAVRAAEAAGLRVPSDLSVIGFDGIDTSGWLPEGNLTTVEQPMVRKGRVAGALIAELLAGRTPRSVTLPVHLRPGTTTAPPRATSSPN